MTPRDFFRLFWKAIQSWFNDGASRYGAAIAYYTLFALAPVLLVVIGIAGLAFGEEAVRGQIVNQIAGLIGRDGAQAIQAILQRASEPREGVGATVLGGFALVFATTGAFLELQAALNKIWHVKTDDQSGIDVKAILTRRLKSFGVVVSIGFLLMVSLTVSAAVNAFTSWLGNRASDWPMLIRGINESLSLGLYTVLFAILYRLLPDVKLEWRHVWVGAFVTALLFTIGLQLIGGWFADQTVLNAALAYQSSTDWHTRRPALVSG